MRAFQDENFLLSNETARRLYWNHAAKMPIIDYHNHLNPQEIYEDGYGADIARLWLGGDHYKWRAMRANGVSEDLVTGNGDAYENSKPGRIRSGIASAIRCTTGPIWSCCGILILKRR